MTGPPQPNLYMLLGGGGAEREGEQERTKKEVGVEKK